MKGRLLAVALTAGAVVLAGACLVQAASDWMGEYEPESAVAWNLASPAALTGLAESQFTDEYLPDHRAKAAASAKAALAEAPLDAPAVRILALTTELDGDDVGAGRLMRMADARSRRDLLSQLWLYENAILRRDFDQASIHADAVLRQQWRASALLFPAMIEALNNPAAVAPFVTRLREWPDWRGPFLSALALQAPDPATAERVYLALAATPQRPSDAEASHLIDRMVEAGDTAAARATWMRLLPTGAAAGQGPIYDGDFAGAPGATPFNWRLSNGDGAAAELGPTSGAVSALHVLSPAERTADLAEEIVVLTPGVWRLAGAARLEPGAAGDLFAWRLTCVGQGGLELGEARIAAAQSGWTPFATDITVPASCPAAWLRLQGVAHEGFQPSEAWSSHLRLTPRGG